MRVHAGAVVAEDRLRHEGHGLSGPPGDISHDVFIEAELVGHPHQFLKPHVDLALPGRRHLVVLRLDVDPTLDHRLHHLVAEIHQLVGWRTGEVALLVPQLVAEVWPLGPAPCPLRLDRVEVEVAFVGVLVEPHVIEHEELGLRADEAGVGDAGALQIVHRLAGHIARIAGIVLPRDRILHVTDHHERGDHRERIDEG